MLTSAQLQLITAAVDGELSAPEMRAFRALLQTSPEARALFAKLQIDSERVRALPRATPPADLQAKIMARIAAATPAPRNRTKPTTEPAPAPTAPARRVPLWVPVAIAASILLFVVAGSFTYFNSTPRNQVAKNTWSDVLPTQSDSGTTVPSPTAPPFERPDPTTAARLDVIPVPPAPTPRVVQPEELALAPEPRPVTPDFLGHRLLPKLPPFDRVEVRVPFLRPVADLHREDISQELIDELRRDPAFKFDLFVRDTGRGVEVFQNAAKVAGLTVFADAATLEKLKKKQVHAIAIYTECLTPAELAALFAKLAGEDAKFSPRVCDSLHAASVVRSDELELKAVLGLDVGLFKRPFSSGAGQGPDKYSGSKSVNSETIDSVVKSVSKSDKPAMLLTWQTTNPNIPRTAPAASVELKQYLAKRGERKPNAVPALIVIRPIG